MGAILFQHARIFRTSLFNNHVSRSLTVTLGTCDLSRGFPRVQNKAATFINSANDRHDLTLRLGVATFPTPSACRCWRAQSNITSTAQMNDCSSPGFSALIVPEVLSSTRQRPS